MPFVFKLFHCISQVKHKTLLRCLRSLLRNSIPFHVGHNDLDLSRNFPLCTECWKWSQHFLKNLQYLSIKIHCVTSLGTCIFTWLNFYLLDNCYNIYIIAEQHNCWISSAIEISQVLCWRLNCSVSWILRSFTASLRKIPKCSFDQRCWNPFVYDTPFTKDIRLP